MIVHGSRLMLRRGAGHRGLRPAAALLAAVATAATVVGAASAATAALPPTAHSADAAASIERIYSGPITAQSPCNPDGTGVQPDLRAAKYVDYCFATRAAPVAPAGDDLKRVEGAFPAGTIAMVDAGPQCSPTDFAATSGSRARCETSTQVGEVTAAVRVDIAGIVVPQVIRGRILNIEHSAEEVGLLGVELEPQIAGIPLPRQKFFVRFLLRPAPDVGLTSIMDELPRVASTGLGFSVPIALDTISLRFWGAPADHPSMPAAFARNGSGCAPAHSQLQTSSYEGATSSPRSEDYELTGCDALVPSHHVDLTTDQRRPDAPTQLGVTVRSAASGDPAADAAVNPSTLTLTLPAGLSIGAQAASGAQGLPLCRPEQFAPTSQTKATCPAGSAVGTVDLTSPTSARPFRGTVYVGPSGNERGLPQLFVEADNGGLGETTPRIKLTAQLGVGADGRLVTTFADLPDLPFGSLRLVLRGGDNAMLSTPGSCGTFGGQSVAQGRGAAAPQDRTEVTVTIDDDCAPRASAPSLAVNLRSAIAGADGTPSFVIGRPDRSPRLTRLAVQLPPGMLASLRGVPACAADLAATGACPSGSRVGSLVAQAGVGPGPATLPGGAVYLTDPAPGALAALTIVVPVALGDLSLGTLVVPASITLRPDDLGLDLSADLPSTVRGIPIDLRSLALTLDRPGFARNPTVCAPLSVTATLTSDDATTANVAAPVQSTDCGSLPFAPQIGASLSPHLKVGDSAGLAISLAVPAGHAPLRQMTATLPSGIGADLTRLGRACPVEEFRAGRCPDSAKLGNVSAELGILDESLRGRVVVVRYPKQTLPGIGIELGGRASARIEGQVAVAGGGQLKVTLDHLPDVPILRLTMTLEAGANSLLKASTLYCAGGKGSDFGFSEVAQTGATAQQRVSDRCAGAPSAALSRAVALHGTLKSRASGRPTLSLTATAPAGRRLRTMTVVLAPGMRVDPAEITSLRVRGVRLRAASRRTLLVSATDTGRRTLRVVLQAGTLQLTPAVRRTTKRLALTVTARYTDGILDRRRLMLR